jgi:SAM-dependent methyltransferase
MARGKSRYGREKMSYPRADERPDGLFYAQPRFVTHIDDAAIAAVTDVYREHLPPGGAILDLMSSWISHLPEDVAYGRVDGLGMNALELAANPRLQAYVVHDLNANPTLPYAAAQFDAVTICVSVDYLTQPVAVLRECGRVTKPGGVIVITFSNRCFPSKVIAVWHTLDDAGRVQLVADFLQESGVWTDIQTIDASPDRPDSDPLFAVIARSHIMPVIP